MVKLNTKSQGEKLIEKNLKALLFEVLEPEEVKQGNHPISETIIIKVDKNGEIVEYDSSDK